MGHKTGLAKRQYSPMEDLICPGEANRDCDRSFYINAMGYQWAINLIILKPEDF